MQTSAQSEQIRMHWRISIFSAEHASAHDVHMLAQNIVWRAAVASNSSMSPCTSGCIEIIFASDIAGTSGK